VSTRRTSPRPTRAKALRRPDGRIATVFTTELPWPSRGRASSRGRSTRLPPSGYLVTLDFAEVGGRLECVRFSIGAAVETPDAPEPEPVTASAIRSVPLQRLIDKALAEETKNLRRWARRAGDSDSGDYLQARAAAAEASLPRAQGRPREYSEEHFKEVADAYTRAWKIGDRPTKAVAEQWQVSRSTAAKWVARARATGLLPATERGRPLGGDSARRPTKGTRATRPPHRSPELERIEREEAREAMENRILEEHEAWLAEIMRSAPATGTRQKSKGTRTRKAGQAKVRPSKRR
jgi:transposase